MAFDGIITKALIAELKPHLIGGKINKIFEPTKNDIVLSIYNNGLNYTLAISCNPEYCRIGLTTHTKPNPQVAPNFCMLLRKYLVGAKIIDISNMDLERTVEIKFETYNELNDLVKRKLFIEIMSRQSNIILTNENNIIIDTLKHIESNNRELLPAHEYTFTPILKKSFLKLENFSEFHNLIKESENSMLSQILPNIFIGFSKNFILYSLNYLNISDSNYSTDELEKIYNYINEIIINIGTNKIYCVNYNNDYTITLNKNDSNRHTLEENMIYETSLTNNILYENSFEKYINTKNSLNQNTLTENTKKQNLNINFFIDNFYYEKERQSTFISSRNNLLKIVSVSLKKIQKKLENINSKLKECSNMDTYKLYGELLTANLYKFKNSPNLDKINLENYYDNNNLIEIPLDKTISIHKNIDKYFKKYNKLKNALEIVSKQKIETEKELDYIQSIVFSIENAKNLLDINEIFEEISENIVTKKDFLQKNNNNSNIIVSNNKKNINNPNYYEPTEKIGYTIISKNTKNTINTKNTKNTINAKNAKNTRNNKTKKSNSTITLQSVIIDGYTIYIGKNNIQNDYLSLKFAEKNDYWFHTQKIHGSHVLLKTNNNTDIPDEILIKCATLAKENSKASNSSNVPVDYCLAKFIKKASGSKPGMVTYTNYKTIYIR